MAVDTTYDQNLPGATQMADPETAQALSTTQRVTQLQSSGYSWLPTQTLFALTNAGLSDQEIRTQAEALRTATLSGDQASAFSTQAKKLNTGGLVTNQVQTAARQQQQKADDGFKVLFSDPVLQKAPSAALALKQYISGAIGPWPINESDLAHTQQQLQLRGYGTNLPVDGTWNADWQQANTQYVDALYNSQLAGNKPGSTSLGHALQALNGLMPVSAFNSLIGFANSLPDTARALASHLAGGVVQLGMDIPNLIMHGTSGFHTSNVEGTNVTAAVNNALGGPTQTGTQVLNRPANQVVADLVQDVSTIMMLTSTMGAGSRFANAINEARTGAALTTAEASQAGGVVANTVGDALRGPGALMRTFNASNVGGQMVANPLGRAAAGAVLGGTATGLGAHGTPWEIAGGAAAGAALGGLSAGAISEETPLLGTLQKAFNNMPVLKSLGPALDHLADENGLYYRTRSLVAQPYTWTIGDTGVAPVALAGQALQDTTVLGAEARGLAAIQSKLAPTAQSTAIQNTHIMDTVNDAVKFRLPILGTVDLNALQFVLHGTPGQSTAAIGTSVDTAKAVVEKALADPGWSGTMQRITGQTAEQAVKALHAINPDLTIDDYTAWLSDKVKSVATKTAAEMQRNDELTQAGLPVYEGITAERAAALKQYQHEIRSDPSQLHEAVTTLAAQRDLFEQTVRDEITKSNLSPQKYLQRDLAEYLTASNHARDHILPYVGQYVEGTANHLDINGVLRGASNEPGGYSIAHLDTLTHQDANAIADRWETQANDIIQRENAIRTGGIARGPAQQLRMDIGATTAPVNPMEHMALESEINNALRDEFGILPNQMPQDLDGKIKVWRNLAMGLAGKVSIHPDAPQAVKDAEQTLNDMGWKSVSGTDIGHRLIDQSPLDVLAGKLTYRRRIIEAAGLNPAITDERTLNAQAADNFMNILQKKMEADPSIVLPPLTDPRWAWAHLQTHGLIDDPAGRLKGAMERLFQTPKRLAKAQGLLTETGAPDVQAAEAAMHAYVAPQTLSFRQIQEAFSDEKIAAQAPAAVSEYNYQHALHAAGVDAGPMVNDTTARAIQASIREAYAAVPARYVGAQHLENLFRNSLGFAGRGPVQRVAAGATLGAVGGYISNPDDPNLQREVEAAIAGGTIAGLGGDKLGFAVANLPNALINLRNDFRFDIEPFFAGRRWAKANVKLAAEGIPPTFSPLADMQKAGTAEFSRQAYEEATGIHGVADDSAMADEGIQALRSADVFGFNPRNFEIRAAGIAKADGRTPDEIHNMLIRAMNYGTMNGTAGRSPLERTVNMFFFPFSFDKTLYRNLGGYLLDNPAQRIMLVRGMAAYNQFNADNMDGKNPLATSWWTQHAPLATEVSQLNAFAHGISLGEPGGINRPLLNLFLPQAWSSSKNNLDMLKRYIPLVKDFSRVYSEASDQTSILSGMAQNMWHTLGGIPALQPLIGKAAGYTFSSPPKSTLTTQAQIDAGFTMQYNFFKNYSSVLDFNTAHTLTADKIKFPTDPVWGDYAGQPITKTLIRQIVHGYYPAFDPNGAVTNAIKNSEAWNTYTRHIQATDPALYADVKVFTGYVSDLQKTMKSSTLPAADVANLTTALRQKAASIAEKDATFYSLYAKQFGKILGPLERVQ